MLPEKLCKVFEVGLETFHNACELQGCDDICQFLNSCKTYRISICT